VANNVLHSTGDPVLRLQIDKKFKFLGEQNFVLKNIADVNRHHFARIKGHEVTALIVVQFEAIREGTEGNYQFSIPPADKAAGANFRYSPERISLGGFDFVHNTWAYDNGENINKNRRGEAARTAELLARRTFVMSEELIMSRFVTEIGEDQRKELIIFYIEPLSRNKSSLEDFPDGGPVNKKFDSLSSTMTERSLKVIRFLEDAE
jgi:hypothetical protein